MVSQPRAKRKWPRMPEPETKIDTKFVLGAGANHCRGRTYRDDYLDCNDVKCAQAARKGPAEAAAPAGTPDVRQKQQLSWLPRPLSISRAAVPKGQAVRPTWHPPAHPTTPEVHKKTTHLSRRPCVVPLQLPVSQLDDPLGCAAAGFSIGRFLCGVPDRVNGVPVTWF